jgi:putative flippase GtrA
MLKVAMFYLVFTPASTALEHFMTVNLGMNEYLATAINMILNFTTEFLYQRYYVFAKTIDSAQHEKA